MYLHIMDPMLVGLLTVTVNVSPAAIWSRIYNMMELQMVQNGV
jgi:hypothetical protein